MNQPHEATIALADALREMQFNTSAWCVSRGLAGAADDIVRDVLTTAASIPVTARLTLAEAVRHWGAGDCAGAAAALELLGTRALGSESPARKVEVRLIEGAPRVFVVWPVRAGWHAAPPCGESQPVYATPEDAGLAHARTLHLAAVDAREVQP